MWRLPDGTFKIVEINARAGYAVNMMISSIFNSNFSVSCYRVIAGLPRRPEEEYFKRLIELRKENRNLSKSSMCLYIHYKGTGRVEDIFDFNFLDTYVNDIEK